MDKHDKDSIAKATKRAMDRMPLAKLRHIPKFSEISEEDYFLLIKNAEIFAILILESYIATYNSNGRKGFESDDSSNS